MYEDLWWCPPPHHYMGTLLNVFALIVILLNLLCLSSAGFFFVWIVILRFLFNLLNLLLYVCICRLFCRCICFSYFPSSGNLNTGISVETLIDFLRSLYFISSKCIASAHYLVELDNSKKFDCEGGGGGLFGLVFCSATDVSSKQPLCL